jgi:RNA polymerase sigma-70 factor (ECF subfamily)
MELDFSALVRENIKPVYSFVYRLTGSAEDAEDITQEAFVKAWKSFSKYRPEQSFRSWMFAIARNTAIDTMRKRRETTFSNFENDDGDNNFVDSVADTAPLPDELVQRMQDAEVANRILQGIQPYEREVVILRHQEDLTFDEIGQILNRPLHTVKSQYRRAILKLRSANHAPKT